MHVINTLTEEQAAPVSLEHLLKANDAIRGIARDEDNRCSMFVYRLLCLAAAAAGRYCLPYLPLALR